jgi:hypothetical protein
MATKAPVQIDNLTLICPHSKDEHYTTKVNTPPGQPQI